MPIKRKVFFSFHFEADAWRAAQIRNAGLVEGDEPLTDNDWESVKRGGDTAIKRWVEDQLTNKSCAVVLIGSQTSVRKWVKYEIERAWNKKKGLVGIHIHGLEGRDGKQATKGSNPFDGFTFSGRGNLANVVKAYDPPFSDSKRVYKYITENIAAWIEEAIRIRQRY